MEVISTNDLNWDDLDLINMVDTIALSNYIEEIVVSIISYHLMQNRSYGKLYVDLIIEE